MNRLYKLTVLAAVAALAGCAQPVTRYGDAKGVETVTNEFGSTDLQSIAESMARSMQTAPAIVSRRFGSGAASYTRRVCAGGTMLSSSLVMTSVGARTRRTRAIVS